MQMYYTALVLPPELDRRIRALKEWMRDRFGCTVGLRSQAHITLLPPFWMHPDLESSLRDNLDRFAGSRQPFTCCTNDFSAFQPRTLFVDLAPNEALQNLKRASDDWFRKKIEFAVKVEDRPFHPHITIATRDIGKAQFAEAWAHFEKKEFRECWEATAISLLRHNGKTWDVMHAASFA